MYCNDKLKKKMRETLNKHKKNSIFLKEMATVVKEQLNALVVRRWLIMFLLYCKY
jgi:hypothetical protein